MGGVRSPFAETPMKSWILALAGAAALAALPLEDASAHGAGRAHISIGFGYGYGYPRYYRPYRYYSPSSYVGFGIWPRYRARSVRTETRGEVSAQELYVYPAAGQSESQMADDRYDCHVWAVDATDFDPTLGAGTRAQAESYGRAFTACMEGRDYVVK
jgi:hypothetical protein